MDNSSGNSELIGSLEFLRPTVKRLHKHINNNLNLDTRTKIVNVLKGSRVNISEDIQYPQFVESLTSLILKRNTEKQFLEKYAALSYTSLFGTMSSAKNNINQIIGTQEKPFVKVTVVPKSTQTHAPKAFRKRKQVGKKIHATVSDHEKSISTRNLYPISTSRRKHTVYKIKATGSVKLANTYNTCHSRDESLPIEQISSLKLVLDSLNMDQKAERDRNKTRKPRKVEDFPDNSLENNNIQNQTYRERTCTDSAKYNNLVNESPKDCVRIIGRLGITEGDQYVLRYAATVKDRPVKTDFNEDFNTVESLMDKNGHRYLDNYFNDCAKKYRNQKDFVMQTNFSRESRCGQEINTDLMDIKNISKETQGTQVNFDIEFKNLDNFIENNSRIKDKVVQCRCTNTINRNKNNKPKDNIDIENKNLKRSQSPLVVISVYPVQDGCENIEVVTNPQIDNNGFISQKGLNYIENANNDQVKVKINNTNTDKFSRSPRSLSRSPQRTYKSKTNIADKLLKNSNRKISPAREQRPTIITNRTTRQIRLNQENPNPKRNVIQSKTKKNKLFKTEHKSTNTEHNVTKKLLIDDYTKQLTAFLNNENVKQDQKAPLHDSKVAINIDGDNEYYDVLLSQGQRTTDLKVRKTLKVPEKPKNINQNSYNFSPTSKNLLIRPDSSKRQSKPQAVYKNELQNGAEIDRFSVLRLRDSIEISQRRRETPEFSKQNHKTNRQLFGKHYRGDSCTIPDPIKRDQEIRTLLGINNGRHNTASGLPVKQDIDRFLRCNFDENCNNLMLACSENVVEIPTCCDIRGKQCDGNINAGGNSTSIKNVKCECKLTSSKRDVLCVCAPKPVTAQAAETHVITSLQDLQCECYLNKKSSSNTGNKIMQWECLKPTPINSKQTINSLSKKSDSVDSEQSITNIGTQYEVSPVQRTSLYQQLIFNRNLQVFLQMEQFSKQKPIILSRKQYDKVKGTIENKLSAKSNKRKRFIYKTSWISEGEVRKKTKQQTLVPDKYMLYDKDTQTHLASDNSEIRISSSVSSRYDNRTLFSKECKVNHKYNVTPRQAASSVEIRCTSFTRHVTFSSTNVEAGSIATDLNQKDSLSLHTIFKGRRRCRTPNLGTSVYSLNSEQDNYVHSNKLQDLNPENKQKKPFLRRLMSCLVMRAARVNEANPVTLPPLNQPSESTVDSYHISTSLGAVELTSSIYDTSASFYTNHSVYPVNSKIKRGFFSSVREFLTSRKS